jgi:uncharacterized membrane protein YjgN (DUF898 family)
MNDAAPEERQPLRREAVQLTWTQPRGMIGLSFTNFLLKIVTLGIYGFWGKTEVRRRIWSSIRLNGEPLRYTGTGKELFFGFLIVFGVVVLPVMLSSLVAALAFGPNSIGMQIYQITLYAVFFLLLGVGIHRAQRYRLARTIWRGVRGGLDGSSWGYAITHFWTGLLVLVTLGWASPWRTTRLQGLIFNDMRFGDRHFRFDASAGPLYPRFAVLWIGGFVIFSLVIGVTTFGMMRAGIDAGAMDRPDPMQIARILGIIYGAMFVGFLFYGVLSAWYRAGMMNHFAAHTTFEGLGFCGSATTGSLIWLTISNLLIVIFTFGLLAPVAQARSARYFVTRLSIAGEAPLAEITQGAADAMKRGEGLAQVFDVDAF